MTKMTEQEKREILEVIREARAELAAKLQSKRREWRDRVATMGRDNLLGLKCPRCRFSVRWFEWGGDCVFGCRPCATAGLEPVFRYVDDFARFVTPEIVSDSEIIYRGERWTIKERKQWT